MRRSNNARKQKNPVGHIIRESIIRSVVIVISVFFSKGSVIFPEIIRPER